jgi:hypothetical protein
MFLSKWTHVISSYIYNNTYHYIFKMDGCGNVCLRWSSMYYEHNESVVSTDARLNGYCYLSYVDPGLPVAFPYSPRVVAPHRYPLLVIISCTLTPACRLSYALSVPHTTWSGWHTSFVLCSPFIWIWCLLWFDGFIWILLVSSLLGFVCLRVHSMYSPGLLIWPDPEDDPYACEDAIEFAD